MNESLKNRAAAIRAYLSNVEPAIAPVPAYKYAATACRWESTRLLIDSGKGTAADDARFAQLSDTLRRLTARIGLPTCTVENKGANGIPGLTDRNGFLPRDPSRIVDQTWQQAADEW